MKIKIRNVPSTAKNTGKINLQKSFSEIIIVFNLILTKNRSHNLNTSGAMENRLKPFQSEQVASRLS